MTQPYVTALFVGLGTGGLYAMIAMSYNLVYQSSGVFNFAQGDLFTIGGLITFTLVVTEQWSMLAALIPVAAAVTCIGLLQQGVTITPVLRRGGNSTIAWIVTTLGASVVLANLAQLIWGSQPRQVPDIISGSFTFLGAPIPKNQLLVFVVAIVIAIALEGSARRTLLGKAWRAVAQDPEAAAARGIPVRRIAVMVFALAAAVSGIGGLITVPVTGALWNTGALLALNGFVAIALGGFGSQAGAVVGGIILGIAQAETTIALNAGYATTVAFVVLVVVLLARPQGLFGERLERTV
jgi:branched-chain amino acid transport system permease protein